MANGKESGIRDEWEYRRLVHLLRGMDQSRIDEMDVHAIAEKEKEIMVKMNRLPLSIRIPEWMRDRLQSEAAEQGEAVSRYVEWIILSHWGIVPGAEQETTEERDMDMSRTFVFENEEWAHRYVKAARLDSNHNYTPGSSSAQDFGKWLFDTMKSAKLSEAGNLLIQYKSTVE